MDRQTKKTYEKIRLETLKKLQSLSPEQKKVLEEEYKQFLKDNQNGMQL
jgi:hypothetical protein